MKNLLYRMSLGVFLLFALGACSEEQDNAAVQILPTGQGTFTDPRDGVVYKWIRYGKLEWMAENLRAEAEKGKYEVYVESYQTSQERELQRKRNFERFGYWYDFAAAESAVPDGWRLPTDEDWQYLERALGMSPEEVDRMDWRGDRQGETVQQKSGMDLMPGGFFDYDQLTYGVAYTPEFMGFYGFFWSSTPDEALVGEARIYRQIRYRSLKLGRFSTHPEKMMNVRCVREANEE